MADAEPSRFIKADYTAEGFSWAVDETAVARAELVDGKLTLLTNAPNSRLQGPPPATKARRH